MGVTASNDSISLCRAFCGTEYTVLPADSYKIGCQLCWCQCFLTLTAVRRPPKMTEGFGPGGTIPQIMTHEKWRNSATRDSCVALSVLD